MAVTLTKEFWTNFVLFVVVCIALGLSIWAFATPCKKDKFGAIEYDCNMQDNSTCLKISKYVQKESSDPSFFESTEEVVSTEEVKQAKSMISIENTGASFIWIMIVTMYY